MRRQTDISRSAPRNDDARILAYLDILDQKDEHLRSDAAERGKRWSYRRNGLQMVVEGETGPRATLRVFPRALTDKQLWMLSAYFIYPGSYCTLTLLTAHNMWQEVRGLVLHCRYVGDGVHEIVLRFEQTIELGLFAPQAIRRKILVVDDEEMSRSLITVMLRKLNADAVTVENAAAALAAVETSPFDLVLLDLAMPEVDGYAALSRLRERGFHGPIVALTAMTDPADEERCREVGFDDYIPKPVTYDKLSQQLQVLCQEPMYSTLADDPTLAELIETFVRNLQPAMNALQIALRLQDWATMLRQSRSLRADAGGLGFEMIAERAEQLEHALLAEADTEQVNERLHDVIALCRTARSATPTAQ